MPAPSTHPRTEREADLLEEARRATEAAQKAGAGEVTARLAEGRSTEYGWRDGQIEKVQDSKSKVLDLELYVEGRYAVHRSNDLRPDVLRRFVEDAVALTRALEPDPHRRLPDPSLYPAGEPVALDLFDPALETPGREACLDWLRAMDEAAHRDDRVISATSQVEVGQGMSARVSSNGFEGTRRGTSATAVTEVTVRGEGARRPEDYAYARARHLDDMPAMETIASDALARALRRLGSRKGASTRTTLVLDREAAASFLGPVFAALTAAAIQQQRSFLADRIGERVAAAALTIVDDPLRPRGLGSRAYDGEGLAARRREIFDAGVLKTAFVDTYYGRKLGWLPTTGSASNLVFEGGAGARDEILAQVGEGVYVTGWAGGNCDETTGEFSYGIRGHEIENGEVGAPLGEMNVTGSYADVLADLVAVGSDPFPYSALRSPTLAFAGVQVSGL